MIIEKYQRPELGELYLDKIQVMSRSFVLDLLTESGKSIGGIYLLPDKQAEDSTIACELQNFSIKKDFRGSGLGSLIMSKAIQLLRDIDMRTVKTGLGNERTLRAFCANFDEEALTFSRKPMASPGLVRLPGGREQAEDMLAAMRMEQFPDNPDSSEHLRANPRLLYAQAVLV